MTMQKTKPCSCDGLCCGSVPFSQEEADKILEKVGGKFEKYFERTNAGIFTKTQEVRGRDKIKKRRAIFSYCKFLDKKTKLCTIYDLRPKVCREYKCDG